MTDTINEARDKIHDCARDGHYPSICSRVGAPPDAVCFYCDAAYVDPAECDRLRTALVEAEAELAAARAAMPTAAECERVADAFESELMEAPKARREWLAAGAAWLDRLSAYHAAHPAASSDGTGRADGGGS